MLKRIGAAVSLLAGLSLGPVSECVAAVGHFTYDAAGHLTQNVDDQGQGATYSYDSAGNLLQVSEGLVPPQEITLGALSDQRRNDIVTVELNGTGLAGIEVKTSHSGIIVSHLMTAATMVRFRLAISNVVPLGQQTLVFQGNAGSLSRSFNVLPARGFALVPAPVAVAPDGIARKFSLFLSESSSVAQTFNLTMLSPAIAKTKTGQVYFPAGATEADIGVIGLTQGMTLLRIYNSNTNEPVDSLVLVAPEQAARMQYGRVVGVSRGLPTYLSSNSQIASTGVRVSRGLPMYLSANSQIASSGVRVSRGLPMYLSANSQIASAGLRVSRSLPTYLSPNSLIASTGVRVYRGAPWFISPTTNPLVAPLVGISRP